MMIRVAESKSYLLGFSELLLQLLPVQLQLLVSFLAGECGTDE